MALTYFLAAPWSSKDQCEKIWRVERLFSGSNTCKLYSPFRDGLTRELTIDNELNKLNDKLIFQENCNQIDLCDCIIAIMDPFDKDTFFEVGYFIGTKMRQEASKSKRVNDALLLKDIFKRVHLMYSNESTVSELDRACSFVISALTSKELFGRIVFNMDIKDPYDYSRAQPD